MKYAIFIVILAVLKESHPLNPEILKYDQHIKDFEATGRQMKKEAMDQKVDGLIQKRESWTIICPTRTQLLFGSRIPSPIAKSMANRAALCMIGRKILGKEKQDTFETCFTEHIVNNMCFGCFTEELMNDTMKGRTPDTMGKSKPGYVESSSMGGGKKPDNDGAAERSTVPGVMIEKVEAGKVIKYTFTRNYSHDGTSRSQQEQKDEKSGPGVEDLFFDSIAHCSKIAGYDGDPSDPNYPIKVSLDVLACKDDTYEWAKKLIEEIRKGSDLTTPRP